MKKGKKINLKHMKNKRKFIEKTQQKTKEISRKKVREGRKR